MKKITLLFAALCAMSGFAQVLTYSAFSNTLSTTLNVKLADPASFDPGLLSTTGSGVTWNASGLTPQAGVPDIHFIYGAPGSTPHGSLYPTSNYVQYDPALTAFLEYDYYEINSTGIYSWGTYAPSGEHEIFQDTDKIMSFPLAYGDTFNDVYAKTNYSNATTVSSTQTGSRTVTFNGYGTLILPQGTFPNVALISQLRTNSLGPDSTSFTWWDLTTGKQLMFFSENDGNVNAAYNSDAPLSTYAPVDNRLRVTISPNPARETVTIAADVDASSVEIYNALGQMVYVANRQNGFDGKHLDVSQLAKGVCFVKMNFSGSTVTSKLIVE